MKKIAKLFTLICVGILFAGSASEEPMTHPYVRVLDITVQANRSYNNVEVPIPFGALAFEFERNVNLSNAKISFPSGENFNLSILEQDGPEGSFRSPLFCLDENTNTFDLYSGNFSGKFRLYILGAPRINATSTLFKKGSDSCEKPTLVLASEWRKGLADPIPGRTKQHVNHSIVHHSATSNNSSDYLTVVRNIYLYHLEVNGWDDVGYNYLIAPNGTIYQGRDPLGVSEEDSIKGAHFCGKNTGTMGICLVGNFMEESPKEACLKALEKLLTWKCNKDGISALGSSNHPNSTDPLLAHIAGHRDGCATACPGDSAYPLLNRVRNNVFNYVQECNGSAVIDGFELETISLFPIPVNADLFWNWPNHSEINYSLFNSIGQPIDSGFSDDGLIRLSPNIADGLYWLQLNDLKMNHLALKRIVVVRN